MHKVITSSSLIRNLSILGLAIAVTVVVQLLRFSGAEAQPQPVNRYIKILQGTNFRNDIKGFSSRSEEIIKTYHAQANEIFNRFIGKMVKQLKEVKDDKQRLALVSPPPLKRNKDGSPTGERQNCDENGKENLSTYCLSRAVVEEYFLFRGALVEARAQLQNENVPAEALAVIDREVEIAQQTLDMSLAAYNELQMALPLHQKYIEVMKGLEGYRDKISAIRKEIEQFPPTFLNVSTTACT